MDCNCHWIDRPALVAGEAKITIMRRQLAQCRATCYVFVCSRGSAALIMSKVCVVMFGLLMLLTRTPSVSAEIDPDLERLVYRGSPTGRDALTGSETYAQHEKKRLEFAEKLSRFHDVNDRLMKLLERDLLEAPDAMRITFPLFALACRHDLPRSHLESLVARATPVAKEGSNSDELSIQMAVGVLHIIANYPSPAHEELAIKFAETDEFTLVSNAVKTLGEIGSGERSLGIIEQLIEKRRALVGHREDFRLSLMEASRDKIVQRIGRADLTGAQASVTTDAVGIEKRKLDAGSPDGDLTFAWGTWLAWIASAIGAAGLLWLCLRRRIRT
jgi:hypothetical protein